MPDTIKFSIQTDQSEDVVATCVDLFGRGRREIFRDLPMSADETREVTAFEGSNGSARVETSWQGGPSLEHVVMEGDVITLG